MQPGEGDDGVALVLAVAKTSWSSNCWIDVIDAVGIGIVGDLEVVAAELGDEAKLVGGICVVNEGAEAAVSVGRVVENLRTGGARP